MRLGVVFALDMEFAPWRRRAAFHVIGERGVRAYEARIGGTSIRVAMCGVGAPHARAAVDCVCPDRDDALVVAGIGGGLRPQYAAGQVLAAGRVHDTAGADARADERLLAAAAAAGATIVHSFVSADRIVGSAADKRRLGIGDDAVDMESAPMMAEARSRRIRAVAVRVVGDTVSETLPIDLGPAIDRDGRLRTARLLAQALRRPDRWPAQVRFARTQQRSLGRLADFLDRFVAAL